MNASYFWILKLKQFENRIFAEINSTYSEKRKFRIKSGLSSFFFADGASVEMNISQLILLSKGTNFYLAKASDTFWVDLLGISYHVFSESSGTIQNYSIIIYKNMIIFNDLC